MFFSAHEGQSKKEEQMAKASIHIKKSVGGITRHNVRYSFSYSVVFLDEKNEHDTNLDLYKNELEKRREKYTERTGQKLQKTTAKSLSAIINLEQHHTLKDLAPIKTELEKQFDTKVYQMAIHRDEGKLVHKENGRELYSGKQFFLNTEDKQFYFDKKFTKKVDLENYEIVKNYHAHIEFLGIDSNGASIRKKMSRTKLQHLQTFTAKALNMERGQQSKSYTKEQMKEILEKVGSKKDYPSTKAYAISFNKVAKELGILIDKKKRLDVNEFKNFGTAQQDKKILVKQKDLKEIIKELRTTLKEQGGEREDYAKLEQLNKDLKTQIKAKELTIEELEEKISEYQDKLNTSNKLIDSLKTQNNDLNEELVKKDEKINSKPNLDALTTKMNEEIEEVLEKEKIDTKKIYGISSIISFLKKKYFEFKAQIKSLTAENEELQEENTELKIKVINLETKAEATPVSDDEFLDTIKKLNQVVKQNKNKEPDAEDTKDYEICEVPDISKSKRYR